jgi:AraC family transcriptional regulator of adaptative response / DNA-3-methyladenine glycosylase II
VRAATTLAGRIVHAYGAAVSVRLPGVTHCFPSPSRLYDASLGSIGIPAARAEAIRILAKAVLEGSLVLDGGRGLDETLKALRALPGIGDWTAQYVAMRALGEPDAFPASDLGVCKALSQNGPLHRSTIAAIAEAWRPYRAYAVMHLWRSLA